MRSELKSGKGSLGGFLSYLKGQKKAWFICAAIVVGLLLLLLSVSPAQKSVAAQTDEERIEAKLAELCASLEGVGSCKVMVSTHTVGKSYGSSGETRVESVVILCRGGGNERVKKELTELVVSLYGIGSNRVKVGVLGKK